MATSVPVDASLFVEFLACELAVGRDYFADYRL